MLHFRPDSLCLSFFDDDSISDFDAQQAAHFFRENNAVVREPVFLPGYPVLKPPIPNMVIKNRFLYRNRFLRVDFHVKFKCLHRIPIRSSRIRLPSFGASGRISCAGFSLSSL